MSILHYWGETPSQSAFIGFTGKIPVLSRQTFPTAVVLNINGAAVVLFLAGGIVPSCLWHRGRTASPRRRPASYEHKNKKQRTVRGPAVETPHTSQTNKFIANSSFCLSPSILCRICMRLRFWCFLFTLNNQITNMTSYSQSYLEALKAKSVRKTNRFEVTVKWYVVLIVQSHAGFFNK